MKNIIIIGATSAIANACAKIWAAEKNRLFLIARNKEKLEQTSQDLKTRGAAEVYSYVMDANDITEYAAMLETSFSTLGNVDIVLMAHGSLPNQEACQQNEDLLLKEFSTNCLSIIALLTPIANRMEAQKKGHIAVISSVAGDRGRASNYAYGSAKAAVSTFCDGLRARLFQSGVNVITIKPGFVDTPMTQGLSLPQILVANPENVAKDIVKAIDKKKNILYTPRFWQFIMLIIKTIPNFIAKRLKI